MTFPTGRAWARILAADAADADAMAGAEMQRRYGFSPLDRLLWASLPEEGEGAAGRLARRYPEARHGKVFITIGKE